MPSRLKSSRHRTHRRPGALSVALWSAQALAGAAFMVAGAAKLYGVPDMVALFDQVGAGQWLRHLTGAIEFGAGALLFVPELAPVAAALLVCTMAVAIAVHLTVIGGSALPAIVLLGCCAFIVWGRRGDLPFRRRPARAS